MDNNEELRLKDAQWFANELGKLTAEDQNKVFEAKTIDQMRQIYGGDAPRLLRGKEAWQIESSLGNRIEIPNPRTAHMEPAKNQNLGKAGAEGLISGAGLSVMGSAFTLNRIRNREYNKFKKERDEFADEQAARWKENPDEAYAKSEDGARSRAINEFHDRKLSENPEKLTKWAEKHNDPDIRKAIKRKEILEKENPKRDAPGTSKTRDVKIISQKEQVENHQERLRERQNRPLSQQSESTPFLGSRVGYIQENKQIDTEDSLDYLGRTPADVPQEINKNIPIEKPSPETAKSKDSPSVQEVMDEIKEIEDEIKHEQKKEERSAGTAQYSRPQTQTRPQQPAPGSSFNTSRSLFRTPRVYRRAQRVRRRFGPGGVSKGVGKKAAKKGAAALGRAALSNPYVLAAIGIVIAIIVGFIIIIGAILHACEVHKDLGSSLSAGVTNTVEAALLFPLMLIGREIGLCEAPYEIQIPPNPPGVTTEKRGEVKIENGENIPYSILKVTYDSSAPNAISPEEFNNLSLFDVPLYDFAFVEASGNYQRGTADDDTKYIQWVFSDQAASQSASYEFELTLSPIDSDIRAINVIYVSDTYKPITYTPGTPQDGPLTSTGPGVQTCGTRAKNDVWYGADCLPTKDTCDGRWRDQMYGNDRLIGTKNIVEEHIREGRLQGSAGDGYNFGDPLCSFKAAKVDAVIDSLVEAGEETEVRGEFWKDIAYCEGTPNSFGTQKLENSDPRPMGPVGYFQMNVGTPIVFKAWQKDNPIRGDVPWQRQIQNAIEYNNRFLKGSADFSFWGAAKCLCAYPGYRDKAYCKDLYPNDIRPIGTCNDNCQERGEQGPTL